MMWKDLENLEGDDYQIILLSTKVTPKVIKEVLLSTKEFLLSIKVQGILTTYQN